MNFRIQTLVMGVVLTLGTTPIFAQSSVQVGRGSYAAYAPLSKSRSTAHSGDQSRYMQYRPLNIREQAGRPIPTNDWWSNMINADDHHLGMELTGHLWSYPQYVQGMKYGVDVQYPKYWIDNGTEMKAQSKLTVKAEDFAPERPMVESWSDWAVTFSETDGTRRMLTTMAHGVPFTWIETRGLSPVISAETTGHADTGNRLRGGVAVDFACADGSPLAAGGSQPLSRFVVRVRPGEGGGAGDLYGIYLPEDATVSLSGGQATVSFSSRQFLVVALLTEESDLEAYAPYAYSKPSDTRVSWDYDELGGLLTTHWTVSATDLRTGRPTTDVLQGFLPHHYRGGTQPSFGFLGTTYLTPHGRLRLAEGASLDVSYRFYGILPWYGMPGDSIAADPAAGTAGAAGQAASVFDRAKMLAMLRDYASGGSFGSDTYWGGKGLTQMALYMSFAREMGETGLFRQCRDRLKSALVDWLTYTPGESNFFFARDPRFGGLIGYDTSYDSETYNDHHFHYGYYTLAGAMLALVDDDFRQNYGPMLRLVAKDYANWERDSWSCFLRTFDPWGGHSFAGGLGDGNGNGQESTSEAMQGWGGLYLLGVALGDRAMRDAGIFGWVCEARGTAEYWFDRHGAPVDDAFHTTYDPEYNIDYSKFRHTTDGAVDYTIPYNSNYTCHGVGWWTYFSGDPVWMAGIQWMPISPALDYLSEDKAFAAWDFRRMWELKEIGGWYDHAVRPVVRADGSLAAEDAGSLGEESGIGNVVLSYLQRSDPAQAAAIFDRLWAEGKPLARNTDTGGITYFVTHSHLTHGDVDWTVNGSTPTSRAYNKQGVMTYMGYNPTDEPLDITFYRDGALVYTLSGVPPRQLRISGVESQAVAEVVAPQPLQVNLPDSMEMRNIALGRPCFESSHENVGTVKENATDGDPATRWGSAHLDGEWLTVDLGEEADIYRVRILWEAAFASEYDILVSSDNARFHRVATALCSQAGWVTTDLADGLLHTDARGRYVRIVGQKRGTAYGVSLFELEVYGRTASMTDASLLGLKVEADAEVLRQGQPTALHAKGYTCGGAWTGVDVAWSSSDGTVTPEGLFTPSAYGTVSVTAAADGLRVTRQLPCEEAIVVASLSVTPKELTVVLGESASYEVVKTDQFGVEVARERRTYEADEEGTFVILVEEDGLSDGLTVSVVRFEDVNLALGGRASQSSVSGDSDASRAIDGDPGSRWESQWQSDDEWLEVDLRGIYKVNRFVLRWEAAFARAYSLEVSTDGEAWTEVYSTDRSAGGVETLEVDEAAARYVRLQCRRRALAAYGYSLFELEVYGTEALLPTFISPAVPAPHPALVRSAAVYDLSGRRVGSSPAGSRAQGPTRLAPGFYIAGGRKAVVRQVNP